MVKELLFLQERATSVEARFFTKRATSINFLKAAKVFPICTLVNLDI